MGDFPMNTLDMYLPDPAMLSEKLADHVAACISLRATAELERERVDKIQRRVLSKSVYMGSRDCMGGEAFRVLEPKDTYLMRDADAERYFGTLNKIHILEGFAKAAEGYCPALTAEHEQRKAEWALIDASREFFPTVTNDGLLAAGGCAMRQEWIDTIIKLVLST
jgi:hypothetical protein